MGLEDETGQDGRALLSRVMRQGVRVAPAVPLVEVRERCRARVAQLPATVRALESGVAVRRARQRRARPTGALGRQARRRLIKGLQSASSALDSRFSITCVHLLEPHRSASPSFAGHARALRAERQDLSGNAGGAALHHPLDLGQRGHAGVARGGHGQRAVGGAAFDGILGALTRQQPVDEARGEGIAAADPVPDLEPLAVGRGVERAVHPGDGAPVVERRGRRVRAASWRRP